MAKSSHPNLFENWPSHYFETDNIFEREAALQQRLQASPAPADARRLEILHLRYGTGKRERPDGFMRAWLMLKVMASNRSGFSISAHRKAELYSYLKAFGIEEGSLPDDVLLEEWRDFASRMIGACRNDRTYRTTGFGLVPVSEEYTDRRIAEEIRKCFHDLPAECGFLEMIEPLYRVVSEVYCDQIEHGSDYLKQAGR